MPLWPQAAPFDPEDRAGSPVLETVVRGPGGALPALLLAAAGDHAWTRRSAVAIARAFVRTGRRILLVDAALGDPGLHSLLGVANDEGLVDHFLFGTSLERLARPVEDGAWGLVPAGPPLADAAQVLGSEGWQALIAEAAARDALLLLYTTTDTPGADRLAERVGAVIGLLADPGDEAALRGLVPRPFSVVAVLGPAEQVGADEEGGVPPGAGEPAGAAKAVGMPQDAMEELPQEAVEKSPRDAVEELPQEAAGATSPPRSAPVPPAPVLPRDTEERHALIAELRARQRAALQAPPPDLLPAERERVRADRERVAPGRERLPAAPVPPRATPEAPRPAAAVPPVSAAGVPPVSAAGVPPVPAADAPPESAPEAAPVPEAFAPDPGAIPRGGHEEPPVARRAPEPPRRRVSWTLLVVLLVSLLAGAWHFWGRWQESRAAQAEPATAPEPEAPAPVTAVPDTMDALLPYLVAIEAHPQLPTAESRVLTLRQEVPDVGFLIVPLVPEGTLYYHVMAGPVLDSARARMLVDTLVARRVKTGANASDIRVAPLAFLVAEYATQDSADARVAELRRLDIPTYVLPLGADPARWRVYAGGYNGPAEADVMRQLLESVGLSDSLVPRTGRTSR